MSKSKPARGEKAKAIRQALEAHPHLKNRELAALLTAQGIRCGSQDIANQKARNNRLGKESDTISVDALLLIKTTIKDAGGHKSVQQKISEVDELADKVGGLTKLRRGLELLPQFQN